MYNSSRFAGACFSTTIAYALYKFCASLVGNRPSQRSERLSGGARVTPVHAHGYNRLEQIPIGLMPSISNFRRISASFDH
jgi:hypothetical protein